MKRKWMLLFAVIMMVAFTIPSYAEEGESISYLEEESKVEKMTPLSVKIVERGTSYLKLKWNDSGAENYRIFRWTGKKYVLLGTTQKRKYSVSGLKPGYRYAFKVEDGNSRVKISSVTQPARVGNVVEKNIYEKKAKISWTCKGAHTGYQVRYSKDSDFEHYTSKFVTSKKVEFKKLKKNTQYYVKVRAYKEYEGKRYYGIWSAPCSFKYHSLHKSKGKIYMDGILIVNKTYSLPANYRPGLKKDTKTAFNKLRKEAARNGVSIWIGSGYRSYAYQKTVYNNYLRYDSRSNVDTYSARPGHSEHQSGLAIDLNSARPSYNGTKADRWVRKNCYKYGFIIRYPDGKSGITGYKYEPWHLRYVGKELAKELYNGGKWITLEEHFSLVL